MASNDTKLKAYITALVQRLQDAENAGVKLLSDRRISNAYGETLDMIGEIVGQSRGSMGDDDYRDAILFRILINQSSGNPEILLGATKRWTEGSVVHLQEYPPACVAVYTDGNDVFSPEIVAALQALCPAGVRFQLRSQYDGPTFVFSLDDGSDNPDGLGLSEEGYEDEGRLTELIEA